jgi:predicted  nucleic acid-binding Zn-ribbon protein
LTGADTGDILCDRGTKNNEGVDVMALSQEDYRALETMFESVRAEVQDVKADVHRLEKKVDDGQAQTSKEIKALKQGQKRLEKKMDEGLAFLRECINEAAVDIGRTNKSLREHVERPIR